MTVPTTDQTCARENTASNCVSSKLILEGPVPDRNGHWDLRGSSCYLEQCQLPSTSGKTAHVTLFQWAAHNAVELPKQSCHDLLHHVVGMGRGHRLLHVALELAGQLASLLLARALQGQLHQAAARLVARQVPNVALQSLTCRGTRSAQQKQKLVNLLTNACSFTGQEASKAFVTSCWFPCSCIWSLSCECCAKKSAAGLHTKPAATGPGCQLWGFVAGFRLCRL